MVNTWVDPYRESEREKERERDRAYIVINVVNHAPLSAYTGTKTP